MQPEISSFPKMIDISTISHSKIKPFQKVKILGTSLFSIKYF